MLRAVKKTAEGVSEGYRKGQTVCKLCPRQENHQHLSLFSFLVFRGFNRKIIMQIFHSSFLAAALCYITCYNIRHVRPHTQPHWGFCATASSASFALQGTGRYLQHVNTLQVRALEHPMKDMDVFTVLSLLSHTSLFYPSFSMLCKHVGRQKNTMSLQYLQSDSLTSGVTVSVVMECKFLLSITGVSTGDGSATLSFKATHCCECCCH